MTLLAVNEIIEGLTLNRVRKSHFDVINLCNKIRVSDSSYIHNLRNHFSRQISKNLPP